MTVETEFLDEFELARPIERGPDNFALNDVFDIPDELGNRISALRAEIEEVTEQLRAVREKHMQNLHRVATKWAQEKLSLLPGEVKWVSAGGQGCELKVLPVGGRSLSGELCLYRCGCDPIFLGLDTKSQERTLAVLFWLAEEKYVRPLEAGEEVK